MLVIPTNKKLGYPNDFRKFLDFKRFEKVCGDFVFVEGFFEKAHQWEQFNFSQKKLKEILTKRIVRLEIEEPNKFNLADNPDEYDHYFEKIFTICPYTAKWLNKRQVNNKRIPIYYPTNENCIPEKTKKIYEVIYIGNLVSNKLINWLEIMSKFNYRWVSFSNHPLVTNRQVTYKDKMQLLAQTKISIVHNVLFPRPYHILNIWRAKDWRKNKAWKMIPTWREFWKIFTDKEMLIPQAKSRLFESALARNLILCRKDPFNIIERYFEPGKEFIYFDDNNLGSTIKMILSNYGRYEKVAENAFKRAQKNYTTRAFVKNYLSKI